MCIFIQKIESRLLKALIPKFKFREGVWFDDFKVEVTKSKVAAVSDYYPFGMLQAGNSTNSSDPLGNKYLYNGKELQEDLGLQWYPEASGRGENVPGGCGEMVCGGSVSGFYEKTFSL